MNGKYTLFALIVGGLILLAALVRFCGYKETAAMIGVRPMAYPLYDALTITSAAESYRDGLDPLVDNPHDPGGRPLNYPRVWHLLLRPGLNQSHTIVLGGAFIVLFLIGVFLFLKPIDHKTGLFLAAVVLSPAALTGMDRGNSDLLIFFILALALRLLSKASVVSLAFILGAFALKLFPIFGLSCFLKSPPKPQKKRAIIATVFVLLYIGLTFNDLLLISEATPKGRTMSYGMNVVSLYFQHKSASAAVGVVLMISACVLIVSSLVIFLRTRKNTDPSSLLTRSQHIDSFRMGAAIYVGTFLFGNNYDYRLVFLLFAAPQIIEWTDSNRFEKAWAAKTVAAAILFSVWSLFVYDRLYPALTFGNYIAFILDEFANWTLFMGLLFLLIYTIPNRMFYLRTGHPQ